MLNACWHKTKRSADGKQQTIWLVEKLKKYGNSYPDTVLDENTQTRLYGLIASLVQSPDDKILPKSARGNEPANSYFIKGDDLP